MDETESYHVNVLRNALADDPDTCRLTDFDLLRWLQQYDNDIDEIEPKLRQNFKLVKSWDAISYERHPCMIENYPGGVLGCTGKDNNLLYIENTGKIDVTGLMKSVPFTKVMRSQITRMEIYMKKLRAHEAKTGRLSKFVVILDFDSLKFDKALLSFITGHYRNYCEYFTSNYGDIYEKFIAVNVPHNAYQIYKLIKPFLPSRAYHKVVILGPCWKTEILDHVDADALPVHWGGTLVDKNGDAKCGTSIVLPEGKVSDRYFWNPSPKDFAIKTLTQLSVSPGKMKFVTVHVQREGASLEWYFVAHSKFGFGVYFTTDEWESNVDNMQMVFPDIHVYATGTVIPESDKIVCGKVGFYKLRFNNQPSWITALKVHYKVWIE